MLRGRKLAYLLVVFLGIASLGHSEQFAITDFSCGLENTQDASLIGDGCASSLKNVNIRTGSIETREGSIKQNDTSITTSSSPLRFTHQFVDNSQNFWLLFVTSNSLYSSSNGGVSNTLITSTYGITSNSDFSAINAFGKARLTDGATNWILWDGSNLSVSTASPKGKTALFYNERIWTSIGSTLYASALSDPEDWTEDELPDDDAFAEPVRSNDGYSIRALIEFRGNLYVFKDYSIDMFSTNDGLTYGRTPISSTVGTKQAKSIQVTPEEIIFLGPDNFYSYNGVSLTPISTGIKTTVDSINQLLTTEQAQLLTTQTDFTGGQSTYTSITQVSGSVLPQNYTATDSSFTGSGYSLDSSLSAGSGYLAPYAALSVSLTGGSTVTLVSDTVSSRHFAFGLNASYGSDILLADWVLGTSVSFGEKLYYVSNPISTGSWSGVLYTEKVSNTDFDSVVALTISTMIPTSFTSGGYSLVFTSFTASSTTVKLLRDGNVQISSASIPFTFNGSGEQIQFSLKRLSSGQMYVYARPITEGDLDETALIMSGLDTTYSNFPYAVFGYNGTGTSYASISATSVLGWTFNYMPLTGKYVSRAFDLTDQDVKRMELIPTYFTSVASVTYSVYHDTDTSISTSSVGTFVSSETLSTTIFNTPSVRYIRYQVVFEGLVSGFGQRTTLDQVLLDGLASTGTYITPSVNVSSMTYWGPVGITQNEYFTGGGSDPGSIAYTIYTDTDTSINLSNSGSYVASQSVVNGQVPTLSTSSYVRLGASFTVSSPTTSVKAFDAVTFNYGSGVSFPAASVFYNSEYLCAVSIASATLNDQVIVRDENKKWTLYDNINAYSMTLYRQKPYVGRADGSNIFRILVPGVFTDNNAAYTSNWQSKEFNFGFPSTDKTMNRYYVTGEYKANQDVNFIYGVNRSTQTTTVDVNMDTSLGSFRKVISPTSTTTSVGRTHRFKFENTDAGESFTIHSVVVDPRKESNP
jgi:hypothetical protein